MPIAKPQRILVLIAFVVGTACGALAATGLSWRASRLYLQMTRVALSAEQDSKLKKALSEGDIEAALGHAACAVHVAGGYKALAPEHSLWDPGFPLMGAFVNQRTRYPVDDDTRVRAMAHARLGVVWERLGREGAARREYQEAASLAGVVDPSKLREVAAQSLTPGAPQH